MIVIYVTSLEAGAGKTAICAGLGKHLLGDGKRVGFLKPIIAENPPEEAIDSDAAFMKQIFALDEPIDDICPAITDHDNLPGMIKQACAQVSSSKDVIIVEGVCEPSIVEALDATTIIVESYSAQLSKAKFIDIYNDFKEHLLGVVLNKVPRSRLERVGNEIPVQFGEAGINALGVLPEDRLLLSLTVGELAEHIQGEILNSAEKSAELVENFMLGAMYVDPGPEYFGRKANKAVIVGGDRPDMQLAALETSTRCLVLSDNVAPIHTVRYGAENRNIPIILATDSTVAIVTSIEDGLGKTRFNQEKKLAKLAEIMEQHFNFPAVYKGVGLAD